MNQRALTVEQSAWVDLFRGFTGVWTRRVGGSEVLLAPTHDHVMLNRAVGGHHPGSIDVDSIIGAYRDARVPRYWLSLPEPSVDAACRAALRRAGLEPTRRRWVTVERDLDSALPDATTDLHIDRARARDDAAVARMLEHGFDLPRGAGAVLAAATRAPGWHVWVARDGSTTAAVGALYTLGQDAYLGYATTRPEYRGRGAQRALMLTRMQAARQLGCVRITTETGEAMPGEPNPSEHNMLAMGMRRTGYVVHFAPPGTTW